MLRSKVKKASLSLPFYLSIKFFKKWVIAGRVYITY